MLLENSKICKCKKNLIAIFLMQRFNAILVLNYAICVLL